MAEIKLKPCPFCGSDKIKIVISADGDKYYYVYCQQCYTYTSYYANNDAAVKAWNRRVNND